MSAGKGLPLTKEEVMMLVNLVEGNSVVTSKATNASNNKLKEAAWSKITDHFNALVKSTPRSQSQLRLKWENLKKSARKRNSAIRMNNLKTGGGKPEYIPPDDALDRVASILGATCGGYNAMFGGDSENVESVAVEILEEIHFTDSSGVGIESIGDGVCVEGSSDGNLFEKGHSSMGGDGFKGAGTMLTPKATVATSPKPKKFFFTSNNSIGKQNRKKLQDRESQSRADRNFAVAEYYKLKKQRLEENLIDNRDKIKLEIDLLNIQKRKLELEVLELENRIQKNK